MNVHVYVHKEQSVTVFPRIVAGASISKLIFSGQAFI